MSRHIYTSPKEPPRLQMSHHISKWATTSPNEPPHLQNETPNLHNTIQHCLLDKISNRKNVRHGRNILRGNQHRIHEFHAMSYFTRSFCLFDDFLKDSLSVGHLSPRTSVCAQAWLTVLLYLMLSIKTCRRKCSAIAWLVASAGHPTRTNRLSYVQEHMPLAHLTTDTDEEELRASHMESEYNDIRQAFFEAFEKQCFGAAPPLPHPPFGGSGSYTGDWNKKNPTII